MNALKTWFENAWWSWGNCISFRFDKYEDNIDRCAFFEEISIGYYEMYIYDFDALTERLNEKPDPKALESIRKLLDRRAPWDT